MFEENPGDLSRRTFVKGATATGVGAAGLAAYGGNVAAQQNLQIDSDVVNINDSLLAVTIQNVNVLNNVDVTVQDITVTIQDIDVTVTDLIDVGDVNVITVDIGDVTITDNVVQVAVNILAGNKQLGGTDTVPVIDV